MATLEQLPFARGTDLLGPPPRYAELREGGPVVRVVTPAGDPAWLVIGYAEVRDLYQDPRLGRSHPRPAEAARVSGAAVAGGPSGEYETEKADHARMRRLLMPAFSARRMARLRVRVQELVEELLAGMAAAGPPGDLHESLSFPLPALVICELLGVPYGDRADFRRWSAGVADTTDAAASERALAELRAYMGRLVAVKRTAPGEDVISDLLATGPAEGMTDGDIAELAAGLLFAGHETTMGRIDLGTVLLLTHPDQAAALRSDPGLVVTAVEEILRYAVPSQLGLVARYAHTDLTVAGVDIRAGEAVLFSLTAANRDPAAFEDPDRFDIARTPNPHLGFAYGPHFCLGASLARVELQSVFATLPGRFPGLALAVPPDALRVRDRSLTGGLDALPVTW